MHTATFLRVMFAALLALLALGPATSAAAAEQEVFRYSFRGRSGTVAVYRFDGCVSEGMSVRAIDGRVKAEGRPEEQSAASVNIWRYDYCGYNWVDAWGYAPLDADAFQINGGLNSATLNATVQVNDYWQGISFPVEVSLTMTGDGDLIHSKYRSQTNSPVYRTTTRTDSTRRYAAASGTAATPFGTFDLSQQSYAYMESVKAGEMTISRQ